MSKRKHKKIYARPAAPAPAPARQETASGSASVQMLGAYEATRAGRNIRHLAYWASLDPAHEMDAFDFNIVMRTSRSLYGSCAEIRKLVKDLVSLTGTQLPLPRTTDEEWNKAARRAFMRRVKTPSLFDLSGRLNWYTALAWMEKRVALDGDCFIILTRGADGGAAFVFVQAPQVWGDDDEFTLGVKRNEYGRPVAYRLRKTAKGEYVDLPARAVLQYLHEPEPGAVRGVPDIIAAICSAADIDVANHYNMEGIKYAASFGLVETCPQHSTGNSAAQRIAELNGEVQNTQASTSKSAVIDGLIHAQLAPGHELKMVESDKPSPETAAFINERKGAGAYSTGLEAEMVYFLKDLTSAAARTQLEKHKDWRAARHHDSKPLLTRMYQYIIGCEMHMGRLPRCKDPEWGNVDWIAGSDKTLDVGRVGNLMMEMVNMGLMSAEHLTLSTCGMTPSEIDESNAHWIAHRHAVAKEWGLKPYEIAPGRTGSTAPPSTGTGTPKDKLPQDGDPEGVEE